MNQVLHIFRKDIRHHWPEVATSLALLAVYGWYDARSWQLPGFTGYAIGVGAFLDPQFLGGIAQVLLPFAWAFLVVRVIQSESLVGDRQFWITRPYEWPSLLAAKLLFLAVLLDVPWLIAQCALLRAASFSAGQHVFRLLGMQGAMWLALLLPLFAISTLTRTVVQTALGVVLVLLALMGLSWIGSLVPNAEFSVGGEWVFFALYVAAAITIVLIQYSRRKRRAAFLAVIALACAVVLVTVATPYRTLINRRFPALAPGAQAPVQLTLMPPSTLLGRPRDQHDQVMITFPFEISGLAPDAVVMVNGVSGDVSAGGTHHHWNWSSNGQILLPEQQTFSFTFVLKRSEYDRMQAAPGALTLAVAMTTFREHDRHRVVIPGGRFDFPGIGICAADNEMICLAPVHGPSFMLVRMHPADSTCHLPKGVQRPSADVVAWGEVREGAGFGISPVRTVPVLLWQNTTGDNVFSNICAGTPIEVSNPQTEKTLQIHLRSDGVRLKDYVWRGASTD